MQYAGKVTAQVLEDKLTLHYILSKLSVQQMPVLLAVDSATESKDLRIPQSKPSDGFDIVVKPSHLCGSKGFLCLSNSHFKMPESISAVLEPHFEYFLSQSVKPRED